MAAWSERRSQQRVLDGVAAQRRGDRVGARAAFNAALRAHPDHPPALVGAAMAAMLSDEPDKGARWAQRAVFDAPHFALSRLLWGMLLERQGRLADAETQARRAIDLDPQEPSSHILLGGILARGGEHWAEAWRERQWWRRADHARHLFAAPPSTEPEWDGSPLRGRTLLVLTVPALGLGDHIQMIRYLPLIEGGEVIVEAPGPLHDLYRASFPGIGLVKVGGLIDLVGHDTWCWLEDLPILLPGDGAPPSEPYLRPSAADVEAWGARLGLSKDIINVGIVWECGERLPAWFARGDVRRLPLATLARALARVAGIRLFSLQVGHADVPERFGIVDVGGAVDGFSDTAAVIANLDLVITVDTAVANLCGAMGAPFWVLLPASSDWRWGLGDPGPWYPTAKTFRTEYRRPGDWSDPLNRVAAELTRLVANRGAGR